MTGRAKLNQRYGEIIAMTSFPELAPPGIWQICYGYIGKDLIPPFQEQCEAGNLETARWLWSLGLTLEDVRSYVSIILQYTCGNGHEAIAHWLWCLGLTLENVRSRNNIALQLACENGHEAVARWLWSLGLT